MKKHLFAMYQLPVYLLTFSLCIAIAVFTSDTITVMSENTPAQDRICIILDAGHGGEDGGAVSCSGVYESKINLQIVLRLDDLLHFLGYRTKMIRCEDISIYTEGQTLAAKKVSDLKNRVEIVNNTVNCCLVSIHQNTFPESRYSGAQVFYNTAAGANKLAEQIQETFVATVNPGSNRKIKKASGIYLMDHIRYPGILIECGFLSNPEEEAKLRSEAYQRKLCCTIAAPLANFFCS